MTQHKITSVSAFLRVIEEAKKAQESSDDDTDKHSDFIYRGQTEDWPLIPKLGRLEPKGVRSNIEQLMFKEFKRTSVALTDLQPESDWDFLAIAQHHGLPTRLLDWSYSALAALWFAVEKEPAAVSKVKQNAVVWLLKTRRDDFVDENERKSPFGNEVTRIYRPRLVNRRIAAQLGIFTVHKMMKTEKSENFLLFETNRKFKSRLIKFTIEASAFPDIRKNLSGCGVNRSALFPDLGGLCDHLKWRYTKLADEP